MQLDVKDRLYTLEHFVPYLLLYKGVASSSSPVPCRRGWISRLPFAPCYAFGIQVSCTQRPSLHRIVRLAQISSLSSVNGVRYLLQTPKNKRLIDSSSSSSPFIQQSLRNSARSSLNLSAFLKRPIPII